MTDTSDTAFEENKKIFLILILLILVLRYAKKKPKTSDTDLTSKKKFKDIFCLSDTSDTAFEKNRDVF